MIRQSDPAISRSPWIELAIFVCLIVAIGAITVFLMILSASMFLTTLRAAGGFSEMMQANDPNGFLLILAVLLPMCLGWLLYAKALQRTAARLHLSIPRWRLGIPLVGEVSFLTKLSPLLSRRP